LKKNFNEYFVLYGEVVYLVIIFLIKYLW